MREKVSNAAGVFRGAGRDDVKMSRLNPDYAPQSTRSGSEALRRGAAAI